MGSQQEKVYRISILTDAAQQSVDAARKKLAQLDSQLEGISKDSDIGRGLVADMAKVVAELEAAEGRVEGLAAGLDNLKPGTLPALRAEIEELEADLDRATMGTAEFEAAVHKLGASRAELKKLEDRLDILADTKQHAAAFVDLANGVVGAFAVMTTAAEAWGLSKETAEEYQQKLLGLITVMQGVESVSRALNTETMGVVKSAWAAGKAYFGMGEAAATGSKVARTALISTGIGALVVLVGFLISAFMDWGSQVKGSESTFTKWKAIVVGGLQAAWAVAKDLFKIWWQLSTFQFGGAVDTFRSFGKDSAEAYARGRAGVFAEARRAELAQEVETTARLLDILKARGTDTLALEVANAKRKLNAQKDGSKEQLDAARDYLALKAQLEKRADDEHRAARLTFLNGLIAAESARGADGFRQQLTAKQEQMRQLREAELAGEHVTQAQKLQLLAEYDGLVLAHDKQLDDKRRALQAAKLNAELLLLDAGWALRSAHLQGQEREELGLAQATNAKQLEIARQHRDTLLAQPQIDWAAVKEARAAVQKLELDQDKLFAQQKILALEERRVLEVRVREAILASAERREQEHQATLGRMQRAGAALTVRIASELAADLENERIRAAARADIGGTLLIRFLGVMPSQLEKTKAAFNQAAQEMGALIGAALSGASQEADAQVQAMQDRLQQLSTQLSEATSKRESDEAKLAGATGARRDYLISRINSERAAEQKLAAERAKAAKDAEDAAKRKAQLDRTQQEISAASSAVEAVLLGIKAARAVVDAADKGKIGYDNIALAIAAAAAIGTSIITMKNLAKYEVGGLVSGPAHAQGGVQMWHRNGAHLGEMEGGEYIINRRATAAHRPLLDMINAAGSVRVLPHPSGHFAAGGQVPTVGPGQVVVQAADLSEMLVYLRGIHSATSATEQHTEVVKNYGPPQLQIGPGEAVGIEQQRQQALQAQQHATL